MGPTAIIACIPKDQEARSRAAGFGFTIDPDPNYTDEVCDQCSCEVYIGPWQRAEADNNKAGHIILCYTCAGKLVARLPIISLGNPNDGRIRKL